VNNILTDLFVCICVIILEINGAIEQTVRFLNCFFSGIGIVFATIISLKLACFSLLIAGPENIG
jgi:hypothetical protein